MIATDNEVLWDDAGIAEQRNIVSGTQSFCIEHEEGSPPSSAHQVATTWNLFCRA